MISCSAYLSNHITVLLCICFLLSCEDTQRELPVIDNREDAVKRESIPRFIPFSAWDFRQVYDYDSNESWISFQLKSEDLSPMLESCKKRTHEEIIFSPRGRVRNVDW